MSRSANEVMVLATKAARGAGAPPAQASQFGAVAARHLIEGRETAELQAALDALPRGPILSLPLIFTSIAEQATRGSAMRPVPKGPAALVLSYIETLPWQTGTTHDGMLHIDLYKPAARCSVMRIDLPDEVYEAWRVLAARLLVPESDASRTSGAGAGLSDND